MADRTILVTGGAGYVGAHACKALAKAGWLPVTYDNLIHGHEAAVLWGPFEHGDINDGERLNAVIEAYRPTAAMHFAAFTSVGESIANPGRYFRNNVAGTLSLLEALRDNQVLQLVFSSTAAVYGTPASVPISEDAAKEPINPYGASKWMVEQILRDFASAHGLQSTALRYFNAAGADPEGQIGELHNPETHLIPLALDAASGKGPALTVYGNDYPTADGTCIRDYIHVTDLADAHVRALEGMGGYRAFNLGTGTGFSVRQVLDEVERVTGRAVPHAIGPRRVGDPPELVAEPTKARQALHWSPQFSDLRTIVATAWRWHQDANERRLSAGAQRENG